MALLYRLSGEIKKKNGPICKKKRSTVPPGQCPGQQVDEGSG